MQVPVWIKPAVWGAVVGAVGVMIVGFSWMGWNPRPHHHEISGRSYESGGDRRAHSVLCRELHETARCCPSSLLCLKQTPRRTHSERSLRRLAFQSCPEIKNRRSGVAAACEIALRTASLAVPQSLAEAKTVIK